MQILHFPFPTPPDYDALRSAEKGLVAISVLAPKNCILSQQTSTGGDLVLTAVGGAMVDFPLSPRHARLILAAAELLQQGRFKDQKLLVYAIGLAATLSTESPFLASASRPADPDQDPPHASDKVRAAVSKLLEQSLRDPHALDPEQTQEKVLQTVLFLKSRCSVCAPCPVQQGRSAVELYFCTCVCRGIYVLSCTCTSPIACMGME